MGRKQAATDAVLKELRAFGLAYPASHTKSPWPGHLDLAVKDKTFAYLSLEGEPLAISCKLPRSCEVALMLPFTKPTPYGLGKSGWISAQFGADDDLPLEMLKAWIDESYRAQAPRRLVATVPAFREGERAAAPDRPRRPRRKLAAAKPRTRAAAKPRTRAAAKPRRRT